MSDIENLETQVSALQDKVIELESDLDRLKNLINQMVESDQMDDEEIKAWAIKNMLYTWANGA